MIKHEKASRKRSSTHTDDTDISPSASDSQPTKNQKIQSTNGSIDTVIKSENENDNIKLDDPVTIRPNNTKPEPETISRNKRLFGSLMGHLSNAKKILERDSSKIEQQIMAKNIVTEKNTHESLRLLNLHTKIKQIEQEKESLLRDKINNQTKIKEIQKQTNDWITSLNEKIGHILTTSVPRLTWLPYRSNDISKRLLEERTQEIASLQSERQVIDAEAIEKLKLKITEIDSKLQEYEIFLQSNDVKAIMTPSATDARYKSSFDSSSSSSSSSLGFNRESVNRGGGERRGGRGRDSKSNSNIYTYSSSYDCNDDNEKRSSKSYYNNQNSNNSSRRNGDNNSRDVQYSSRDSNSNNTRNYSGSSKSYDDSTNNRNNSSSSYNDSRNNSSNHNSNRQDSRSTTLRISSGSSGGDKYNSNTKNTTSSSHNSRGKVDDTNDDDKLFDQYTSKSRKKQPNVSIVDSNSCSGNNSRISDSRKIEHVDNQVSDSSSHSNNSNSSNENGNSKDDISHGNAEGEEDGADQLLAVLDGKI